MSVLADDGPSPVNPRTGAIEPRAFDFLLTREELRRIALRHTLASFGTGEPADEDVVVTAPRELLPMRDVTQEVWGGPAAPVWAVLHPKEAWRIFLPIPPKD
jgi:hypothetical protein